MEIKRSDLETILVGVTTEIANLNNLKAKIQAILDQSSIIGNVNVIMLRYYGVLDDIYDKSGVVTAQELSNIAKRWGRNPKGTAGYFTGANPSLIGIADNKRALSERGSNTVAEFRQKYGENWKSQLDMNFIGNPETSGDEEIPLSNIENG